MKKFQYKKVKYEVPESWDEVPLKMLIKMTSDQQEFKTEATKKLAFISGFCGIPIDVLKHSTLDEVGRLFKYLEFLNTKLPEEPIATFELEGETYNVMPTLLKQEFQDFISLETALSAHDGDVHKALPMLIAILAKKDNETLDDYDVQARADLFNEKLPVSVAHPLSLFFWNSEAMSTTLSQLSLNHENLIVTKAESVLDTLKPVAGMGLLTRLQIGIMRTWIRFTMLPQKRYFTFMRLRRFITTCKTKLKKLFQSDKKHTTKKRGSDSG